MSKTGKRRIWNIAPHLAVVMSIGLAAFVVIFCVLLRYVSGEAFPFSLDWLQRALDKISTDRKFITDVAQVSILALGVVTGAGAAVLAYRKQVIAERQHATDRYVKAVELLYKDDRAIVTGAAYALEALAHDSATDRAKIIEVLCSYFRKERRYPAPESKDTNVDNYAESKDTNADNHAVPKDAYAKIEFYRSRKYLEPHLEAVLFALARLNKSYKDVRLNLSRIDLIDINPNFDDTTMSLRNAKLDETHLERANLRGVHIEKANLRWAYLKEAALGSAHLEGVDLSDANLESTDLERAHLEGAILRWAHLERAYLFNAHLKKADLLRTHLEKADLREANLKKADLYGVLLEGANLSGANLEGVNLREAHLEGVNLNAAYLKRANLKMAHLDSKTSICGATLTNAWHTDNIWAATWNKYTTFPNGNDGKKGRPDAYKTKPQKPDVGA